MEVSLGKLPRDIGRITADRGKTAFLSEPFPRAQSHAQLTSPRSTLFLPAAEAWPPDPDTDRHTPQAADRQKGREEEVSEKPGRKEAGQTDRS